jgi:hypothetical protein
MMMMIIIIIIIIATFEARHICVCSSVQGHEYVYRNACIAVQYVLLTLGFDGRRWSASDLGRKSPQDRRLLGSRGGLDPV